MKVYYVGSGLEGCYNVRCLLPLQANGWDGDRTTFLHHTKTPEDKAYAARNADVVVMHRPEEPTKLELARILKKAGKKVVFDNDDTYKDDGGFKFNEFMNKERLERGLKVLNEAIDDFIKEADLVTCSTPFLADEYRKINPNVIMLPNCVDPFWWDEPLKNETDQIRIGITGSVGITSDMEVLKPIIDHYKNDKRIKFVLLSLPPRKEDKTTRELYKNEYEYWETVDIEWHPFVPAEDYPRELNEMRLDMVIIPRAENYFNRCKSNLKFLENSMLEIPTIAQSFTTGDSPYQQNPEDQKHMLLAGTTEEWIAQIDRLINDKEYRVALGKDAHDYVLANYNIEDKAHLWEDAYKTLFK